MLKSILDSDPLINLPPILEGAEIIEYLYVLPLYEVERGKRRG
jgi:hypothetical protein